MRVLIFHGYLLRGTGMRGKIGEDARAPKTLRTIHGEGYVFDPDA